MTSATFALTALVSFGSLVAGYGLHAVRDRVTGADAWERVPPTEYLEQSRSFSELENARAEMDARAKRILFELRSRRVESLRDHHGDGSAPDPRLVADLTILESAVTELQGTEWEGFLVRDLLGTLKQVGRLDRWLEVYTAFTHRQPANELGWSMGPEAMRIAERLGRDGEVVLALHLLRANPAAAAGHETIDRVLGRENASHTAVSAHAPATGGAATP